MIEVCSQRPWDNGSQPHCDHVAGEKHTCCWCGRWWLAKEPPCHGSYAPKATRRAKSEERGAHVVDGIVGACGHAGGVSPGSNYSCEIILREAVCGPVAVEITARARRYDTPEERRARVEAAFAVLEADPWHASRCHVSTTKKERFSASRRDCRLPVAAAVETHHGYRFRCATHAAAEWDAGGPSLVAVVSLDTKRIAAILRAHEEKRAKENAVRCATCGFARGTHDFIVGGPPGLCKKFVPVST